jgi:transposase
VIWLTRAKDNMQAEVVQELPVPENGDIIKDELIGLKREAARADYSGLMRRVEAWVEVDGERRRMVFLTNELTWSPETIVALYQQRWQIEVFFKQIKQTLKLADFLGTSANAVQWQIWMALLVYLLLRYLAFVSDWSHSFSRLFGLIRSFLWKKWDVLTFLKRFGTADGHLSFLAKPEQAYFPGFV